MQYSKSILEIKVLKERKISKSDIIVILKSRVANIMRHHLILGKRKKEIQFTIYKGFLYIETYSISCFKVGRDHSDKNPISKLIKFSLKKKRK